MSTILHIDMNAFFADVEQQCHPSLRGKPVFVCGSLKTRTVVTACSYEAKAFGVQSGMSVGEALGLCPSAVLVEGNPAKYTYTAIEIFRIIREYSPLMEVFSIDEAFLDVTETQHLFGGARAIARAIKNRIVEAFHLTCSVGIAPSKLLAKLASNMQRPDGLVEIKPDEVEELLRTLPASKLCGIGDKTARHLEKLGIRTVGELGEYSCEALVGIFGKNGDVLHEMGLGRDARKSRMSHVMPDAKSMGHSHTLARDVSDLVEVKHHLLRLSEMVGRRLRSEGYAGRTVHFSLRFGDMEMRSRQKTVDRYIDEGIEIYEVACAIMGELLLTPLPLPGRGLFFRGHSSLVTSPSKPIRFVSVSVNNLTKNGRQLRLFERTPARESGRPEFFAPDDHARRRRLTLAVDKINERYGEFTLFRSSLLASQIMQKTHGSLSVEHKLSRRRKPMYDPRAASPG